MSERELNEEETALVREIAETTMAISALFIGKKGGTIGAVLGNLVARYLTMYRPDSQEHVLASFTTLTRTILEELNGGVDRLANVLHDGEWKVHFSEQVNDAIDDDPKVASFVAETVARIKTVLSEVEAGRIPSVQDALESIGMTRVSPDEIEDIEDMIDGSRRPH